MAGDPKQVSAGGGVAGIADLLKLFGGTTGTTQNTADISGLQALQGDLQNPNFEGLLQAVFQQAAGQTPGLQARMSNAVGARSGQNGAVQAMLQKLLQDTTIKAQGQLVQQQQQNQQLRGQTAGQIAGATGGQKTTSGTNMGKAATGLGALQALGALKPENLKKAYDGVSGFFNSGGGELGSTASSAGDLIDLGNFSIGGELGSDAASGVFGDVGFGEAAAGLGDLFQSADYTSGLGETVDFSSGATDAASTAGDSSWLGDAWEGVTDFFGFADGGMVGRDGKRTIVRRHLEEAEERENEAMGHGKATKKAEKDSEDAETKALLAKMNSSRNPKTGKASDDYDKSSKLVDKSTGIRFANGGEVNVRAGGGRRSSTPGYTPDNILQTLAGQGRSGLNPARSMSAQSMRTPDEPNDGTGLENSNNFSLGVGTQTAAHQAQTQSVINAFMQALVTQNPLTFAKAAFSNDLGKQAQMNEVNKAPDPMAALAAYQGWLSPEAATALGSDNLAIAANAVAMNQKIDPMDAMLGLTGAFGTAPGTATASAGSGVGGMGESANESAASEGADGAEGSVGSDGAGGSGEEGAGGTGGESTGAESGFKNGGKLQGPGTGTSDSIHARVSKGEYIVPADVVSQLGVQFFDDLRDNFHTFVDSGQE